MGVSIRDRLRQAAQIIICFLIFFSVAGAPMQSAGTPQGQPQPSPSQSGQFVFSSPMPGQPQVGAPPQGQVTPGPAPYVYIPSVAPNAVPTSTPSSVSYMPGEWQPFLLPNGGHSLITLHPPHPSPLIFMLKGWCFKLQSLFEANNATLV